MNLIPRTRIIIIIIVVSFLIAQGHGASEIPLDEPISNIVGGRGASKGQFPWTVYLSYEVREGTMACMGFLYKPDWVITAAHCLPTHIEKFKVAAGIINTEEKISSENTRYTREYYIHPEYNFATNENDIGLVKLDEPFTLSANIKTIPISLIPPAAGEIFVTAGFGLTRGGDISSYSRNSLQWVQLPYVDTDRCQRLLNSGTLHPAVMICAGGATNPRADTCDGDSGSGLVRTNNPNNPTDGEVVGITSFGSKNCASGSPGVYTRVAYFYESFIVPKAGRMTSSNVPTPPPSSRPPSSLPPPPPSSRPPSSLHPPSPKSRPPSSLPPPSSRSPSPPPPPPSSSRQPSLPPAKSRPPSATPSPAKTSEKNGLLSAKECLLKRNKNKACRKDNGRFGLCWRKRCVPIYY